MTLSPLTQRRIAQFKANRRGYWSLWIFGILFFVVIFAEFLANDKPLLVSYEGKWYMPIFQTYPETHWGGKFQTAANYRDTYVKNLIEKKGWMIFPPVPYYTNTVNFNLTVPAPSPPSTENWLGTDDQGRDVLARLIYGFRVSIFFGLILTFFSSIIGVVAGAIQGYFGGV